jgi:hypothetical protein
MANSWISKVAPSPVPDFAPPVQSFGLTLQHVQDASIQVTISVEALAE